MRRVSEEEKCDWKLRMSCSQRTFKERSLRERRSAISLTLSCAAGCCLSNSFGTVTASVSLAATLIDCLREAV